MIFCFSATGNSECAAERIAAKAGDKVISIGVALRDKHFDFNVAAEKRIGFVLPTFAYTLPGAVAEFIENMKLSGAEGHYTYGVFTCGAGTGCEGSALAALLSQKGLTLNAAFDLPMIDNFIIWGNLPSPDGIRSRLDAAYSRLEGYIDDIIAFRDCPPSGEVRELYMPIENVSSQSGTSKLHITDKCDGCGLCTLLCPMLCLKFDSEVNRPYWDGRCTTCLACLHRCPNGAIEYGNDTAGKRRYVNPDVKLRTINDYGL